MSEKSKDELIEAQKEVIGILFEIIKRFQANNELDEQYFQLISIENKRDVDKKGLEYIAKELEKTGIIEIKHHIIGDPELIILGEEKLREEEAIEYRKKAQELEEIKKRLKEIRGIPEMKKN